MARGPIIKFIYFLIYILLSRFRHLNSVHYLGRDGTMRYLTGSGWKLDPGRGLRYNLLLREERDRLYNMNISYFTTDQNLDLATGYGQAGFKVVTSLQALGHSVPFNSRDAPVQIAFCSPQYYHFNPGQYRIGYTPWESTELPAGWLEQMNKCDEIWATSEWTANVYRNAGVLPPVFVYEHGIDDIWRPLDRTPSDKVRFLHVGEPAVRKGGQMTLDAFRAAFGDREDVHLTFKTYSQHRLGAWVKDKITLPQLAYKNVTVLSGMMTQEELIQLHANHDVMVYPTYGEGFGLLPLQALATGMPTICTDDWAPYRKYLGPLAVTGRYDRSPWLIHPGDVYFPNYQMLIDSLRFAADNLEYLNDYYMKQTEDVIADFDWLKKTEKAFEHIVKRFGDTSRTA
jgi:glycosyltransferase involved in cell wall biosynthesis